MLTPPERIALVTTFQPSRGSIETMLKMAFPEYGVDVICVSDVVREHRGWVLPNLWQTWREYSDDVLHQRLTLREAYLRTPYAVEHVHDAMRERIDKARHRFSFQVQSLYNTAVPGVPNFVYTDHTHLSNLNNPDFDRAGLRSPDWIALERSTYEDARVVFTRSTDIAVDLERYYGVAAGKVECVYAGSRVEVETAFPPVNDDYRNLHILFVADDWERKGGPDLLAAFREVLTASPDAHLTIVGCQPSVDAPNCTIIAAPDADRLARCHAEASIFCAPARLEGFDGAIVEAMMHRLPILATRVGANPDMVEEGVNGMLVPPGDIAALARALRQLLGSPFLCREYGRRSLEKALLQYNWKNTGSRLRTRILQEIAH